MRQNRSAILLVEGNDDKHVVMSLFTHHDVKSNFEIIDKKGIDELLRTLPTQLKGSELQRLGIMVDADEDIAGRWQSLTDILRKAGYTVPPESPETAGTILQHDGKPTVGIWLMPDNQASGMIEDFIRILVPPNDVLIDYARHCVDGLPERRFGLTHRSKAEIHTWLAWQDHPGTPMGLAITRKYLDAECPHAAVFIGWIRRLFEA